MGSSFRELFWGINLKNRSVGVIALNSNFGGQLWRALSGNNFGERQLSGIILRNICFEAQHLSSRFTRIFGEQFVVIILDNCVELFSGIFLTIILGISFGTVEISSGTALGLWSVALAQL